MVPSVIPFSVKFMPVDFVFFDVFHVAVGDFDAGWVLTGIPFGMHLVSIW